MENEKQHGNGFRMGMVWKKPNVSAEMSGAHHGPEIHSPALQALNPKCKPLELDPKSYTLTLTAQPGGTEFNGLDLLERMMAWARRPRQGRKGRWNSCKKGPVGLPSIPS